MGKIAVTERVTGHTELIGLIAIRFATACHRRCITKPSKN